VFSLLLSGSSLVELNPNIMLTLIADGFEL